MAQAGPVKIVAKILKKRFKELSAMEAIHISYEIMEALEKVTKVEVKPVKYEMPEPRQELK